MTADGEFEPRELQSNRPTAARMYHYYLSGEPIFTVDRQFGERMFELCPFLDTWAHHNRDFLRRATRYISAQGIRQFLDIGSGLPTVGNTHEVARALAPDTRVVYFDNDLEAINRAHELLGQAGILDTTTMAEADLREPDTILDHPETHRLIDFSRPLGLMIVSVWPFVPDADHPLDIMARLRARLAPGSYVAMTHVSIAEASDEAKEQIAAVADAYDETTDPVMPRTRKEFTEFFTDLDLITPGIVYAPDWRPDHPVDTTDIARPCNFAAVGRKP